MDPSGTLGSSAKYETLGTIGRGGMATVFVGRSRGAGGFSRLVAIKRAHAFTRDETTNAALRREAELASRLHHPNVVRVIDVVENPEGLVLVLDYVDGGSLTDLVQRDDQAFAGPEARARTAVRIALDIAAGLDAAHRTQDESGRPLPIIHRDVTPSNVLVGADGISRLTDFGIAKALEGGIDRTETGLLKGKVGYMAPEYLEHQRADASSDQFSLGVVLWEALAARRLFRGPTEIETMKRVVATRVPKLATVHRSFAALDDVVARALAQNPADRFPSVRDLADALEKTARAAGLIATHAEVGAVVERALGAELTTRRRSVNGERVDGVSEANPTSAKGRDDQPTGSIVSPLRERDMRDARDVTEAMPGAIPRPRAPRTRWMVAAGVVFVMALVAGIGARLARSGRTPDEASKATTTEPRGDDSMAPNTSGSSATTAPAVGPESENEATGAPASATPGPHGKPSRSTSGARRGQPSLVPRKAPPNPY